MVSLDDLVDEFKDGGVSPVLGAVVSIFFYAFAQIFIALKAIQLPHNSFTNGQIFTFTPDTGLLFIGIFAVVVTVREFFSDIGGSYSHPILAVAKLAGLFCGIILFWGFLINISQITGGSNLDIVLSIALAFGAPILGIYLRYKYR
jgi:hypothetical protein